MSLGGFRVYDTHTHIGRAVHSGRAFSAAQMLRHMDSHGIERSLLIPFPMVENEASEHDLIGAAVKAHPDRFTGALCASPFAGEAALRRELERGINDLRLRALKLQPQFSPLNPLSARADVFFGLAAELKLPVICHTGAGAPFALPSLFIAPARKCPEVKIVLAHCGSPVYYLEAIVAAQVCANIFLELSSLMPHHIGEVLRHVDASRLMIGSDLPESAATELAKIVNLDIAEAAKRQILWLTGRRLFDGVSSE